MLSAKMYEVGKKYNLVTKYNIQYDRRALLDYVCAIRILQLLSDANTTSEQQGKLNVILNNLIVL